MVGEKLEGACLSPVSGTKTVEIGKISFVVNYDMSAALNYPRLGNISFAFYNKAKI